MKKFSEKMEKVLGVVKQVMQEQGVDVDGNIERIKEISRALMLVEQCLWYRIDTDEKIVKMIATYEDEVSRILAIMANHEFGDLVYTYRATYTNLYSYKEDGVSRWYKLSKKDFIQFLSDVESGKLQVVAKPSNKTSKPKKSASKKQVASKLAMLIESPKEKEKTSKKKSTKKATTKMATSIKETQAEASKPKKSAKKSKKGWVEHDLSKELKERTFCKMVVDGKNRFVRYLGMTQKSKKWHVLVDDHGKQVEIEAVNIEKVYTYVK